MIAAHAIAEAEAILRRPRRARPAPTPIQSPDEAWIHIDFGIGMQRSQYHEVRMVGLRMWERGLEALR